jgi:uncharacterized protein YdeI (YjbR/CyaY-like superfamily)
MLKDPKWMTELELLAVIIAKLPLEKTTKWGADVYTFNGNNVVSYGGFKNHFAIWFFNCVFLSDPYNVLVCAAEGKTKSLRQWRFKSAEEIDEKKIIEYILEAIDVEKKGLRIKPEKFSALPVPAILESEFNKNKQLRLMFETLTPGRQKEYIQYLNEAKQETTRETRINKITPKILAGVGLNDKYK